MADSAPNSKFVWLAVPALFALACGDDTVGASDEVSATETAGTSGSEDEIGDTQPETSSDGVDTSESETEADESESGETTGGMPTPLQAGVAMRHLDRPVGISLAGYGGRVGGTDTPWSGLFWGTRGLYNFPTIKAMVLESDEGERLIMMKTPMMSAESGITDAVAAKYEALYGEDLRGRIIMGGTHSHHAHGRYWRLPDIFGAVGADTADEEVIDLIATAFAETIHDAVENMGDAEWGYTYLDDWDPEDKVYRDRRSGNNPIYGKDPRLTVLGLRRPDGTPLAALFNFGIHGISVAYENELLTEDAPGALELEFEEYFYQQSGEPIFGFFAQAGGGDASPGGGFLGHDAPTQKTELLGMVAAPVIYDAFQSLEWDDDPEIVVQSRRVDLSYEKFGYDENGEFSGLILDIIPIDYEWGGWQCTGVEEDDDLETSMEGEPKQCIPIDTLLIGNDLPHAEIHQTYLSVARLGPLFIMSMPGEPAYSIVKYARDEFAAVIGDEPLDLMVWGYSQDHLLYFTAPDDWYQGGYESEMSLWGPYGGSFMVDTNMSMIEQILVGNIGPSLIEESPTLAETDSFSPRGVEVSQNAGDDLLAIASERQRTERVRWRFGAGDPTLGAPIVRVQVDAGEGEFVDVPHPAGWAGRAYDNTRNEMITHYDPDPAPNGDVAVGRKHEWWVDWEVPADWPAGVYRLVASGPYFNGTMETTFESASGEFMVVQHAQAELAANLVDAETLALSLVLPQPELVMDDTWPVYGWRLHDAWHAPEDDIHVRAPLSLQFIVDGEAQAETWAAEYDVQLDAYVFDFAQTGIDPEADLEVDAWLASDHVASPISATVASL
ncbi:neutral/alkaline non-lysosomal ceramidase N-terminal domain-containing protein [Pseudenhygromyxa sp. WMMC2535]|uniref:neutral/alkaline non-lysosomal ceramidase N-terminal domain-containing protein n=1 Tax=Pseudenhygromyxa sp. WMMC2535 TaxID=2712867 RepID=UPI001556A0E5|nr:neutral/alkaline non-lysosomal ceramidase N-terminal domain-containing protein [Pseudenhygromyxa sp. WMMC2535]NVB40047.1 neutral/alkaline non-lysosomal ceramidase N-terminal domain-containing protein [Pseudenhygromyxa sp. WMMC2535]